MDFMEFFIDIIGIIVGLVVLQIILIYPFVLILFIIIPTCYFFIDWLQSYGWKHIGKINYKYVFKDEEKTRHFVAYVKDEKNNQNKVVQHISASIYQRLLVSNIERNFINAVDLDDSPIEIYSCGPLISHHLTIMVKWHGFAKEQLWLGILRENWDLSNKDEKEEKVERKPYMMIDVHDPERDVYSRGRDPAINYIIGRSYHWQVSLKLKKRVYRDVNVCMHVFEDPKIPLYENFWMFGLSDRKVGLGEDVYIKFQKRKENLIAN